MLGLPPYRVKWLLPKALSGSGSLSKASLGLVSVGLLDQTRFLGSILQPSGLCGFTGKITLAALTGEPCRNKVVRFECGFRLPLLAVEVQTVPFVPGSTNCLEVRNGLSYR